MLSSGATASHQLESRCRANVAIRGGLPIPASPGVVTRTLLWVSTLQTSATLGILSYSVDLLAAHTINSCKSSQKGNAAFRRGWNRTNHFARL